MAMRWRFAEDADSEERRSRRAIVEAIERWWDVFAMNADAIDAHFKSAKEVNLFAIMEHLHSIDPKLMWEFGPAVEKPGHRLCLTPENRAELRPLLQVLLDKAPQLPRWEFYPYRLADHVGGDPVVKDGRTQVSMEGATVSVGRGRGNLIDLSYVVNGDVTQPDATKAAFYSTERLLGEEILDQWIGVIEAKSQSKAPENILRRIPLDRLRPTVESLIDSIHAQLPSVPRYQLASQTDREPTQHSLLKLNLPSRDGDYPRWLDQYLAATPEPELFNATRSDNFYSARFSRFDETFCYLKIGEVMKVDDRGQIEDAITATLCQKHLGCAWGAGTGRLHSYIELALVEVEPAVPILREILRRRSVNQRSWLLFHDRVLRDEWVGIYPQTSKPPD